MPHLRIESSTPPIELIARLYAAAALRRPVRDLTRLQTMFTGSNVIRAAWQEDRLVGLLRGWTDGTFDGFVADLAVDPRLQRTGVGRALMDSLVALGDGIQWVLLASPLAPEYYQHHGWEVASMARLRPRHGWDPGTPQAWAEAHRDLAFDD